MTDVKPAAITNRMAPKTLAMYGLAKAIPGLLMLASVPLWIRIYGSVNYGTFAVVWGVALFSVSLCTGWLRQAGLKYAGSADYRLGNVPRGWIALSVLASGVPPIIVVLTLQEMQANESTCALVAVSVIFALSSAIYYLALSVAQREQRAKVFTLAEGVRAACTLMASVLIPILVHDYSGTTLLVANIAGTLVGSSVLLFRGDHSPRRREISSSVLRSFWSYGWPMGIWQAVAAATLYMDRFFITLLVGSSAAGTYAALADLLVRGFTILSYPIIMAGHPAIMATWNSGHHRKAIRLSRVWTFRLALIVFVGIGAGIVGCILLGERLLGAAIPNSPMLWFLAIGAGFWQLSLMTHKGLEMTGRPRLMLFCLSALVVVSVPANFFLIPIWGPVAAAASFAFSSFSYCVITQYLSQKMLRFSRPLESNL